MEFDPWKEEDGERLVLECLFNGSRQSLRLFTERAYFLCVGSDGVFLREEFSEALRPGLVGVVGYSREDGRKASYKPGHLAPLGDRFRVDRNNGCWVVNDQALFGLGEPVHVVDKQAGQKLEFRIYKC